MKDTQLTLKRYEKKYLLSAGQWEALWPQLEPHLKPDLFFESIVRSLYYDSDNFALIRSSIEKPVYKEKLRVRSYGGSSTDGAVFVELKKKFQGTVYKRRIRTTEEDAERWLCGGHAPEDSQITREIDYLLKSRGPLSPKALIVCDRRAYAARDGSELRITFDRSIRWRGTELRFSAGDWGEELLEDGQRLMEIKMPGSAPLWLAQLLSKYSTFPTHFSKYGTCYSHHLIRAFSSPETISNER